MSSKNGPNSAPDNWTPDRQRREEEDIKMAFCVVFWTGLSSLYIVPWYLSGLNRPLELTDTVISIAIVLAGFAGASLYEVYRYYRDQRGS